ncbi:MAG: HDOD domain-containing protein [candidate division Zixibacteria bacterium]|nr:HDOD domain-containing protein [candidate division Zixibacteria bacterium]
MDKISIVEKIYADSNILSIPQVISELLDLTSQEDYSANDLGRLILKDPSLTARILKLSNSPFYARVSKINTMHQAISVLGVTTVKCLALSTSIFHPEKIASETGIDAREFFAYILSVASGAELIAKTIKYPSPEEALIAGLLQDVGILFCLHHYPTEYGKVRELLLKDIPLLEAEQEVLGANHCVLGYHLSRVWNMPENITNAIAHHHNIHDAQKEKALENIIKLSALLSLNRFSGQEQDIEKRLKQILRVSTALELNREQISEVTDSLLSHMFNMAQDIGVEIEDTEQLLIRANQEIWKSYLTIEHLFTEREELNKKILEQERAKAAFEAKSTALATLSHYLNNTVMVISGQTELLQILKDKGQIDKLVARIPGNSKTIGNSINKIIAVMQEIRDISPSDEIEYFDKSKAMKIDDRIKQRLEKMSEEPAAIFPPSISS